MRLITSNYIKTFNPCESGIRDFDKYHKNFKGTMAELLALDNLSYPNKIWLVKKVVDEEILKQWAVDCAENVLSIYTDKYPEDTKIIKCIEVTKLYLTGKVSKEEATQARRAAYSAVTFDAGAAYAASAVGSAAYSAVNFAAYSAVNVDAAGVGAAYAAAIAAGAVGFDAREEQRNINLSLLIALL